MSISNVNPSDPSNQAIAKQQTGADVDTSQYTAVQKNDVDKIQSDADDLAVAVKSGDKSKIKSARKELKDDFKHAGKDGISKADLKKLSLGVHDEVSTARIASDLASGKVKANDPRLAASMHNDFVRECKARGVDPKAPGVAQTYFQNESDKLQAAGAPADAAQQAVQAAQDVSSSKFVRPADTRA